ncbi:hypothetical protein BH09MYX1_BH09MYX1_49970 [soil metagenome]
MPKSLGLLASASALAIAVVACRGAAKPPPLPEVPISSASQTPASSLPAITAVPPDSGVTDEQESREIRRTLRIVSAIRGLQSKTEVPGKVLSRDALLARVKQHVAVDVPVSAMTNEGLTYQLLGLLPVGTATAPFDYTAQTFSLLESQLAGYYEPGDKTMYMAADLDEEMAFATLSHELVHALQDQYWDLKTKSKWAAGRSDSLFAQSCLAEGDATSVMIDVMLREKGMTAIDLPDKLLTPEMFLKSDTTAAATTTPHFMRASLIAPYVEGLRFVHARRRMSAPGECSAVNQTWDRVPVSTEQILHPAKWDASEAPLAIPAPTFAALGKDYFSADQDTLGELVLRLAFAEWMPDDKAIAAATNWGGDRTALVKKGDTSAFAWLVRWDEAKKDAKGVTHYATDAWAALAPAFATKFSPSVKEASFLCAVRPDVGPIAIASKGRDIVFIGGPTTVKGGSFTSAGDCALAKKWAAEILK